MKMPMRFTQFTLLVSMLLVARSFRMPPHNVHHAISTAVCENGRRALGIRVEASATATTDAEAIDRTVTILQRSPGHIVALKPPAVVCHHSGWTGSRAKSKRGEEPEVPMLQRVRDALHDIDTRGLTPEEAEKVPIRKVNLVHRLDRGASGALLLTYADDDGNSDDDSAKSDDSGKKIKGNTAQLIDAMADQDSIKTYVALVRGEGVLRGEDLKQKGWFEVSRPIKDDSGEEKDATTLFNFVAGQPETSFDRPRVSLVLARPQTGRWHQIRRHLNGLSHPILGDSTHGVSKVNREWREERNMPGERIALHLGRLQLVPTKAMPDGIDVAAPILEDMLDVLRVYAPDVLEQALPTLEKEGILVDEAKQQQYQVGKWTIPEALLPPPVQADNHVDILKQSEHYVVVDKPPVVVVHNSGWTEKWKESQPVLQRVRDKTGKRVNLVHRLDRGASGCLLLSFAEDNKLDGDGNKAPCGVTRSLIEAMQSPEAEKTYLALCDGDGTWNGDNYLDKGWFAFDNPVKDEWGKLIEDAHTEFKFVASTVLPPIETADNGTSTATAAAADVDADHNPEGTKVGRKVSIVLARPSTGRWHQVRQHLASGTIGHAILGDSSHGRSRTNRMWKRKRHLMKERTCLHLARLRVPETEYSSGGIDVRCPLPSDMRKMVRAFPKEFLEEARAILAEEGLDGIVP